MDHYPEGFPAVVDLVDYLTERKWVSPDGFFNWELAQALGCDTQWVTHLLNIAVRDGLVGYRKAFGSDHVRYYSKRSAHDYLPEAIY